MVQKPAHWLNLKNRCVPESRLVAVFWPLTTTGAGRLVVQMVPRLALDCTVTGFYDFMLAKNSKSALKLVTAPKQVRLSNLLVRPQHSPFS
jgi:hypothetical protein